MTDYSNLEPMGGSEFSAMTRIPTHTLADWRKRGIGETLCRPHPNGNGRWLYSREAALQVHIAEKLRTMAIEWREALIVAYFIVNYMLGRAQHGHVPGAGGYTGRYMTFAPIIAGDPIRYRADQDIAAAFEQWKGEIDFPSVMVFDLDEIEAGLPAEFKRGLDGLRTTAE